MQNLFSFQINVSTQNFLGAKFSSHLKAASLTLTPPPKKKKKNRVLSNDGLYSSLFAHGENFRNME